MVFPDEVEHLTVTLSVWLLRPSLPVIAVLFDAGEGENALLRLFFCELCMSLRPPLNPRHM